MSRFVKIIQDIHDGIHDAFESLNPVRVPSISKQSWSEESIITRLGVDDDN